MTRYARDPYWIDCKHRQECTKCGVLIPIGSSVFVYPASRTVSLKILCSNDNCGGAASRDFEAAKQDEEFER